MLRFSPLRVRDACAESEEAVSLTLDVPAELAAEYRSRAGQHVVLRSQIAGQEVRRTYSLVNGAGELPLRIVARIHPRGRLSQHLASAVSAGDVLEVMPPNGSFGAQATRGPGTY